MGIINSFQALTTAQRMQSALDPQKDWLFVLDIPTDSIRSIINRHPSKYGLTDVDLNNVGDSLMLKAESMTMPESSIEEISQSFMGLTQQYAGKVTQPHNFSVPFKEFEDQKTVAIL
jgi:hypothetical protein